MHCQFRFTKVMEFIWNVLHLLNLLKPSSHFFLKETNFSAIQNFTIVYEFTTRLATYLPNWPSNMLAWIVSLMLTSSTSLWSTVTATRASMLTSDWKRRPFRHRSTMVSLRTARMSSCVVILVRNILSKQTHRSLPPGNTTHAIKVTKIGNRKMKNFRW